MLKLPQLLRLDTSPSQEGAPRHSVLPLPASQQLAGETWVLTGTLGRPRDDVAELIRRHGGTVSGSVSKKTSYVLAGEEAGSKMAKAKSLGVPVVDESTLHGRLAP